MSNIKGILTLEHDNGVRQTFKVCITKLTLTPKYVEWELSFLTAARLGLSEDERKGTILVQKNAEFEGYVTAEIE